MLRAMLHDRAAEALLAGEIQHNAHALQMAAMRGSSLDLMNVAISRETGTHGHAIAALVAERLGWQLLDHELLERVAQRMHVPVSLVEQHDERRMHWLEESVAMMSSVPIVVRESHYVRNLVEATLELGSHGHGVFIGRGAAWILSPENTLRVALMAPLEHRVHVVMRERGLSAHDAALAVDECDRQHTSFSKAHFCHGDIDPHAFDIVLNTSRLTPDHCADLIVEAVRDRAACLDRHATSA